MTSIKQALPVPSEPVTADMTAGAKRIAEQINEQHWLARDKFAEHAVECGRLLLAQKERVGYGNFGKWIEANCDFSVATAGNYMKVAKNPNALGKSGAIRRLYPSGFADAPKKISSEKPSETKKTKPAVVVMETNVTKSVVISDPVPIREAIKQLSEDERYALLVEAWNRASESERIEFVHRVQPQHEKDVNFKVEIDEALQAQISDDLSASGEYNGLVKIVATETDPKISLKVPGHRARNISAAGMTKQLIDSVSDAVVVHESFARDFDAVRQLHGLSAAAAREYAKILGDSIRKLNCLHKQIVDIAKGGV